MPRARLQTCPEQLRSDHHHHAVSTSSAFHGWSRDDMSKSPRRHTVTANSGGGESARNSTSTEHDVDGIRKFKRRFRKFFQESNSAKSPEVEDVFSSGPTTTQQQQVAGASGSTTTSGFDVTGSGQCLNKDNQDTRRRRGGGQQPQEDQSSATKEGLPNFIQKKIQPGVRRSKSAKINSGKENRPLDKASFFAQGAHSRNASEPDIPFYMPSIESPEAIDLSSNGIDLKSATVRPLHHSILGKDYCFEVITSTVTRCFGCTSDGERQAWIEKIKRAINPNLDNSRRVEHQLSLYVQEAKGLPSKKKYFCEICLDRKLCARTTSKWKTDSSILWGEGFEFTCLPINEDITVHLYKDSDKKKKKDKDYIGLVNLSVKSLLNHNFVEKWYNLSTPSGNNKNKAGEAMAVRLKARFLSTRVLPTEQYKSFAEYLSQNYLHLCRTLGTSLTAQQKDELSKIMVKIMYATGSIKDYMTELVMDEVEKVEEESLIFRENTVGTKSVEAFLRLVGMRYLHTVFGSFIGTLFTMSDECEVDGSRLPAHADLAKNQANLQMSCSIAMQQVCQSVAYFPLELRQVFSVWHSRCVNAGRPRIAFRLVTASLFLRLLCPAILNPILFGLANEIPDTKTARSLTLVAKVVQNLANRSRFGSKEEYMQFMDKFVRERWDDMTSFVDNVSDTNFTSLDKGFEGYIDLGKEFARLHSFFVELMPSLSAATFSSLNPLPAILSNISELLESPSMSPMMSDNKPAAQQAPPPSSHHSNSIDRTTPVTGGTLNSILEDAPLSNATETIASHESASLAGVSAAQQPHLPVGSGGAVVVANHAASSLMDLRDLTNGNATGSQVVGGDPHLASSHHGSHSSLAVANTCNSNNYPHLIGQHTTNDVTSTSCYDVRMQQQMSKEQQQLPLKFRNPMYNPHYLHQQPQRTNIVTQLPTTSPTDYDVTTAQHSSHIPKKLESKPPSGVSSSAHPTPLSFANPLQQIQRQRHQAATTSTTSTNRTNSNEVVGRTVGQQDSLESRTTSSSISTSTNRKSSTTGPNTNPTTADGATTTGEVPVVIESTVRVSNAHLKTGLQSKRGGGVKRGESPSVQQQQRRKAATEEVRSYPNMSLSTHDCGPMLELTTVGGPVVDHGQQAVVDHQHSKYSAASADCKDGLVPPEAAAAASNLTRIAANINSSNAVRGKTAKRTHSSSTDNHRPHAIYQKQQHARQQQQQQLNSGGRRTSSHQYQQQRGDEQPYQSATSCAVLSAASSAPPPSSQFPPSSPEDTLSPETRTAQWVLNSIQKSPPPPPSSVTSPQFPPEPSTTERTSTKDFEERIIQLESEVNRLTTSLKDKEIQINEVRTCEKRTSRTNEKMKANVDLLATQLEQKNKQLNDANCRESNLRREIYQLREALKSRNAQLVRQEETIESLQRNIQQMRAPPPTPISPQHNHHHEYIDDVTTDHHVITTSSSNNDLLYNGNLVVDMISSASSS